MTQFLRLFFVNGLVFLRCQQRSCAPNCYHLLPLGHLHWTAPAIGTLFFLVAMYLFNQLQLRCTLTMTAIKLNCHFDASCAIDFLMKSRSFVQNMQNSIDIKINDFPFTLWKLIRDMRVNKKKNQTLTPIESAVRHQYHETEGIKPIKIYIICIWFVAFVEDANVM